MSADYSTASAKSNRIPQPCAASRGGGLAGTGAGEHAPALPGCDDLHQFSAVCDCATPTTLKRASGDAPPLCVDMPWRCPRDVPPPCNTGVHTPAPKRSSPDPCPSQENLLAGLE
jgi:hypothetical protein